MKRNLKNFPQSIVNMRKSITVSLCVQGLALLEDGVALSRIQDCTSLSMATIYITKKRAIERGYKYDNNFIFEVEFFTDALRSGQPWDIDEEKEDIFFV
jgi:hypothetical protein